LWELFLKFNPLLPKEKPTPVSLLGEGNLIPFFLEGKNNLVLFSLRKKTTFFSQGI
jgi:hypothetical protein